MFENEVLVGVLDLLARFGGRLIASIVILVIGLFLARRVARLTKAASGRWNLDETGVRFIGNIVYYLLAAIVSLIAINNLGIEISAILAVLGAAGLAVGLALTGAVTNLAAGVITAVLRPFSIGDHVAVCDMDGEVIDIDVFHTTLVTLDNETIILPNADVVGGTVTNFSARDFVRVEVPVSVSLDADMDLVSTSLLVAAKTCKRVLEEPPPEVQIARFGTDAIEVQLEVSCLPLEISEG